MRNLLHVTGGLVLAHDDRPFAEISAWAGAPRERVHGLLRRPPLARGRALVIEGARQIHTFGMSYAIDVVFCDEDWRVSHVVRCMAPRRVTRWVARARYAIEMPAGAIPPELRAGQVLSVAPSSTPAARRTRSERLH